VEQRHSRQTVEPDRIRVDRIRIVAAAILQSEQGRSNYFAKEQHSSISSVRRGKVCFYR